MQNNENYSGFDLTMYNLFTLLREMYYTRGETETNFLQKSGGVLSGSLTIQGNLVINGQSYSIDTENLKVGDYTITLAKDNEQTLTSMVGMVVPKYDGTNYGFFGWDADGYAYVGDLTNYDGTSAITLANNSSLQRISTIDTTNTVVASNGVIYVYDATSHCFKKPTNDNKYYVIRNGAFVETELFTEQKSKNIDNALYNIGAFDSADGKTRQTGYVSGSKYTSTSTTQSGRLVYWYENDITNGVYTDVKNNLGYELKATNDWWSTTLDTTKGYITYYSNGNVLLVIPPVGVVPSDDLQIQYKLATSYTEQVIENQPLLNLDQKGCNFLREEWEKGLNLFDFITANPNYARNGVISGSDNINNNGTITIGVDASGGYGKGFKIQVKANTTYTLSFDKSSTDSLYVEAFQNNTSIQLNSFGTSGRVSFTFTTNNSSDFVVIGFSTTGSAVGTLTISNIMLNEGTHPYPYQEYKGAIVREKDIEPVLLWENSSPNSAMASGGITTGDMSKYKYIEIVYKYSATSAYSKCVFKAVYEASTTFFISSANAQQYGELIVSRGFTFTNSTTLTADKGTKISIGSSSPADDNNKIVPVAIYGTNVL